MPVRVRECDPEGLLGSVVYVDLVGLDVDRARERLVSAMGGGRAKPLRMPGFPGGQRVESVAHPFGGGGDLDVATVSGRFVGRASLVRMWRSGWRAARPRR